MSSLPSEFKSNSCGIALEDEEESWA
jgi:hypothetical protein